MAEDVHRAALDRPDHAPGHLVARLLEKNPNYWRPGIPKVDRIVFRVLPDDTSRVLALMGKDVDVALQVPFPNVQQLKTAGFRTFQTLSSAWGTMTFAAKTAPTDDVRVRKAIMHAIDVPTLNEQLFSGTLRPSNYLFEHVVGLETPPDGFPTYEYDPEKAQALLQDIEWDSSKTLEWIMWSAPTSRTATTDMPAAASQASPVASARKKSGWAPARCLRKRSLLIVTSVPAACRTCHPSTPPDVPLGFER